MNKIKTVGLTIRLLVATTAFALKINLENKSLIG